MELGNHPFPWSFFTWGRAASLYMYIGVTYGAQNLCRRIIGVSLRNQLVYVCIYLCMYASRYVYLSFSLYPLLSLYV